MLLFGANIRPLFGKGLLTQRPTTDKDKDKDGSKVRSKDTKAQTLLHHDCYTCPEAIREEVDALKTDFNRRIKEVLFNSMLITYYVGFIPVCFAQVCIYRIIVMNILSLLDTETYVPLCGFWLALRIDNGSRCKLRYTHAFLITLMTFLLL